MLYFETTITRTILAVSSYRRDRLLVFILVAVMYLFIDAPNRDFRLRIGSPAINRGVTLAEVPVDFNGNVRPQGLHDIGAFDFINGANALPASPNNFRLISN